MKIYVEGKLQTRKWEKDGQMRQKTEIIAENIQILHRPQQYLNQQQTNNNENVENNNFASNDIVEDINSDSDFIF